MHSQLFTPGCTVRGSDRTLAHYKPLMTPTVLIIGFAPLSESDIQIRVDKQDFFSTSSTTRAYSRFDDK